jgi:hypothetical protein
MTLPCREQAGTETILSHYCPINQVKYLLEEIKLYNPGFKAGDAEARTHKGL